MYICVCLEFMCMHMCMCLCACMQVSVDNVCDKCARFINAQPRSDVSRYSLVVCRSDTHVAQAAYTVTVCWVWQLRLLSRSWMWTGDWLLLLCTVTCFPVFIHWLTVMTTFLHVTATDDGTSVPPPFPFGRICFVVLVMRKGGESSWSGPWHLGCTSEVTSYQDQFIQPGWAQCVFLNI